VKNKKEINAILDLLFIIAARDDFKGKK